MDAQKIVYTFDTKEKVRWAFFTDPDLRNKAIALYQIDGPKKFKKQAIQALVKHNADIKQSTQFVTWQVEIIEDYLMAQADTSKVA